jgi:hypothetical protein
VGFAGEPEPERFDSDFVGGHAVEVHDDVLRHAVILPSNRLPTPVDRGPTALIDDAEQLAGVAHAQDLAGVGRRREVVLFIKDGMSSSGPVVAPGAGGRPSASNDIC